MIKQYAFRLSTLLTVCTVHSVAPLKDASMITPSSAKKMTANAPLNSKVTIGAPGKWPLTPEPAAHLDSLRTFASHSEFNNIFSLANNWDDDDDDDDDAYLNISVRVGGGERFKRSEQNAGVGQSSRTAVMSIDEDDNGEYDL
jgi:hypothetical protein